jgi:hypothetical protein
LENSVAMTKRRQQQQQQSHYHSWTSPYSMPLLDVRRTGDGAKWRSESYQRFDVKDGGTIYCFFLFLISLTRIYP